MVEMIDDAKSKNRIKKQFIEHSFLTVAVGTGVSYLSETLLLVFCLLYTKFNLVLNLTILLLFRLLHVGTRIKAVLSDDEGMGQKPYRNRRVSCQDARGSITRKCPLFRTEFTACVLCSFAI